MLSNPPWERIKLQEEEFFASRDPEIAGAANKAARQKLLDALPQTNPPLHDAFMAAKHDAEAISKFVRASGRFPLTAVGDVNTYALFAELSRTLLAPAGRAGIIVPTGIATDDTTKAFFGDLVATGALARLIGYENEAFIFPDVHHAFKFCLLTMAGSAAPAERADLAFFCRHYEDADDSRRRFTLSGADFALINPNTRTCPIFRTRPDAELNREIYRNAPVLWNEKTDANPWGVSFLRMLDMSNDSGLFRTEPGEGLLPLYEAKMVWQYDHRSGSFEGRSDRGFTNLDPVTVANSQDPMWQPKPFYWVPGHAVDVELGEWRRGWLLVYRRITNATNERTTIACITPRYGAVDGIPLLLSHRSSPFHCLLLANLNALCFDFAARQKVGGLHLDFHQLRQLPVLAPDKFESTDIAFVVPRVLELVYFAWDIKAFADDLWRDATPNLEGSGNLRGLIEQQWEANRAATGGHPWDPPVWIEIATDGCPLPPFKWDDDRRALLRAELDAYYARLYGLTRDELRYILDPKDVYGPDFPSETFRVLKEKEERAVRGVPHAAVGVGGVG